MTSLSTAAGLLCCVVAMACGGASAPSTPALVSSAPSVAPSVPAPPVASASADGGAQGEGVTFGTGTIDTGFGDGGGPPPPTSAFGAGRRAQKGLSPDQVRRVVMAHVGAVRACYDIEAQRDPSLKGGVTLQWTIDPSGGVSSASVVNSTVGNPRVEGCIVRQVEAWRFPSSDRPTVVGGFPFKFGVGG